MKNKLTIDFSKLSDSQITDIFEIFMEQHPEEFADLTIEAHSFNLSCVKVETKTPLENKISTIIGEQCEYAKMNGSSKLSTCNHSNWDRDTWNFKDQIIKSIRDKGFNVSVSVNHGVTDIVTTKKLNV